MKEKLCLTCKYSDLRASEMPCDTCRYYSAWEEDLNTPMMEYSCSNCKYLECDEPNSPCVGCGINNNNWKAGNPDTKKNPFNTQVGGLHYKDYPYCEPAEFLIRNKIASDKGHVMRYVLRHDSKNGIEDLRKAKHYLEMMAFCHYNEEL